MTKQEKLKKFEFDLRFTHNDNCFCIRNKKDLNTIYKITTEEFKLSTNSSYVLFRLEEQFYKNFLPFIFIINLNKQRSDAMSYEYFSLTLNRNNEIIELPEYIKDYYD